MGPLSMSAKQHREYLKLQSQEQREVAKMQAEQKRKEQLHEIKLQEAAAKAKQGIGHKEDVHAAKLKEMGSPLGKAPKMNKQKLGIPTQNPLAGTGVLGQGQKKLYSEGTDTVPAMLTPGEAVIPAPAAQNPENKEAIREMIEEGREKNNKMDTPKQYSQGTDNVKYYFDGTEEVPFLDKLQQGLRKVAPGVGMMIDKVTGVMAGEPGIPQRVEPLVVAKPEVVEPPKVDTFQEWKNATMGQETNYGNNPNTWNRNNQGALGFYQLTEDTFNGLKKNKQIPSDFKFDNKEHNTIASEVLLEDTWKRAKGDPAKAAAMWYGGPKAVDKEGNIVSYKDKKNPNAPDTVQYSKEVLSKMPQANVPPVPTGREVMIAKQDLATSTNPAVRRKAEAILAAANQGVPTLAETRQSVFPTGGIDPNIRKELGVELKAVTPPPNVPNPSAVPSTVNDTEIPAPEVQQAPSLLETKPEEANKTIAQVSKSNADIIQGFLNDPGYNQIKEPEEKKSWLERAIASVYGPTGVFSDSELARFAVIAAGGLLTGGSVGGSLKYAGLDALKSADARRAQQGARAAEELKNTRELGERLDSDYRTALGENVPPAVRAKAVELYQGARTPEQKRAVIQLLKMNKSTEDTTGAGKPGNVGQGFFNGQPINFRNQAGNVQRVNEKGEWENIPPAQLKQFETAEDRTKNTKQMIDSTVNRITPVLRDLNKGDKNYSAKDEAQAVAEAFSLLKEDLGPNISATSFAKMSENTIRSASENAKATGTKLTEEGLRKQFFGNAVIETKMVTGNKEMYMAKDDKGKFTLPSAPYQSALGMAIDTYKKQGIDIGTASNAIENKFNNLPPETKKKFTQMSAGAPGSTPMLLWLQQTGGTN